MFDAHRNAALHIVTFNHSLPSSKDKMLFKSWKGTPKLDANHYYSHLTFDILRVRCGISLYVASASPICLWV